MQNVEESAFANLKIDQWFKMIAAFVGNYSTLKKKIVSLLMTQPEIKGMTVCTEVQKCRHSTKCPVDMGHSWLGWTC